MFGMFGFYTPFVYLPQMAAQYVSTTLKELGHEIEFKYFEK
jgi:hypothetical protein